MHICLAIPVTQVRALDPTFVCSHVVSFLVAGPSGRFQVLLYIRMGVHTGVAAPFLYHQQFAIGHGPCVLYHEVCFRPLGLLDFSASSIC